MKKKKEKEKEKENGKKIQFNKNFTLGAVKVGDLVIFVYVSERKFGSLKENVKIKSGFCFRP